MRIGRPLCELRRIDNGWLLITDNGDDPKMVEAFTVPDRALDDGPEEAAAKQALLDAVLDTIGRGSDFSEHQVYVEIRPGDEWDGSPAPDADGNGVQ